LYDPPLHGPAAITVRVVVAAGARDRLRNCAELGVKLVAPGAPVIAKPAGAVICTEPSCCFDASFLIVNLNEVLAPAVGFDGETATAKHVPDQEQVDVDPAAAGPASSATPSMLAAITQKKPETRVPMKPAFGMATPSPESTNRQERLQDPALLENPAMHTHMSNGDMDGPAVRFFPL
jgi:hypothetical protein